VTWPPAARPSTPLHVSQLTGRLPYGARVADPRVPAHPTATRTPGPDSDSTRAPYADGEVPLSTRTEIERLTVRVERDRRWVADGPTRRLPPAVALSTLAVAGVGALATGRADLVLLGLVLLLVTAVLAFVPARRLRRRRRLRRLTRQWAGHRIARASMGARWRPALDVLADSERWLRLTKLPEQAGSAAEELGRALDRARAGTRVDAEIARVGRHADPTADPTKVAVDVDVRALQADLVRAVEIRDGLLAANADAAHRIVELTAAARAELADQTAAIAAVRERALGTLTDSTRDAAALLPERSDPGQQ
jgi:hypothetical protein